MKLLIPISELKSYARVLKKHNPGTSIKRTEILDQLAITLGFEGYNNYERFMNKRGDVANPSKIDIVLQAGSLPLNNLESWALHIAAGLREIPGLKYPMFRIFDRQLPSTPLDKYLSIQIDNMDRWPALRMSGVLYLLSLVSGRGFYFPQTWMVDWDDLIDYLKFDQIPKPIKSRMERFQTLNREQGSRYHEGVIPAIETLLVMGDLKNKDAIQLISEYLAEEQAYLSNMKQTRPEGLPLFSFPLYEDYRINETSLDTFQLIRQQTNEHRPLLLGTSLNRRSLLPSFMGNTNGKTLTLSTEEIRGNIMTLGSAGSGKTMASLCLLRQALMNDTGAIYIDGRFDVNLFWLIKSMMRSHNRENDLVTLTLKHRSELRHLNLPDLVRQKKVVLIMLPALEKNPEVLFDEFKAVLDRLADSLPTGSKRLNGSFFPFGLYLNEVSRVFLDEDRVNWMTGIIDRLNQNRIAVFAFEQDYVPMGGRKGKLPQKFATHLIMKCVCLDPKYNTLRTIDLRDIVALHPGEFRYLDEEGTLAPEVYRFPYADINYVKMSYLVMS